MNPIDTTAPGQTAALTLEFDLAHPPEKVWRALTQPELVERWLLPVTGLDLRVGALFSLQAPAFPGWDGVVSCQVREVEVARKLAYTWCVGGMALDTVVTFTLTPTAAGTRMVLVQSGFKPEQKQNFGGARHGMRMMGEKLVALLGEPDRTAASSRAFELATLSASGDGRRGGAPASGGSAAADGASDAGEGRADPGGHARGGELS